MQAIMQVMDECPLRDEADEASKSAVAGGLWPSLASRLVSLPTPQVDRFNGWIPAIAVAAVCLAMLMVASPQDAFPPKNSTVPANAEAEWSHETSHETHASASNLEAASDPEPIRQRFDRAPIPGMRVDERQTAQFGSSKRNENWSSSAADRPRNFGGALENEFPGIDRRNVPFPPTPDNFRSHWQPPRMMILIEP